MKGNQTLVEEQPVRRKLVSDKGSNAQPWQGYLWAPPLELLKWTFVKGIQSKKACQGFGDVAGKLKE